MSKRMTKAEKISSIPFEKISSLKGESGRSALIGYIRTLRSSYKRRIGSFKRNNLVSQAQIAFEREIPKSSPVKLTEMSRNQLLLEFFRYASFFNSETSSIEGIKRINNQQDIRLFGSNSKGHPNYRMTNEERILFWDTYEEYKNQFPADVNQIYSSEYVQQYIADALIGDGKISSIGLADFLSNVRNLLREGKVEEDLKDVPNVFSGRRDSFKW